MKPVALVLTALLAPIRHRNLRMLVVLTLLFAFLVVVFSGLFHVLMEAEGQQHSWPTAFYWTMVTMSTLGFGDITFKSDAGRIFSVVVLMSGTLLLLVLLPFTVIQFVWVPWMSKREAERAPRFLPPETRGHLVLTNTGPIEDALIERAINAGVPYVVLVADLDEALRLHDRGYQVMVGPLDDPQTYRAARLEAAALVVATRPDTANTNIVFTAQEISSRVPILATANTRASVDILRMAGAEQVLQLGESLGHALFQRILDVGARTRVLGQLAGLLVAEAPVPRHYAEPLSGKQIRAATGVDVIGTWKSGNFEALAADYQLTPGSVLILAGSATQLAAYDAAYSVEPDTRRPVVVIGGGRVGRRVGASLAEAGVAYKIVEKLPGRVRNPDCYVLGDAAELEVLNAAGLQEASAVVITTHDDDVNVYLAIYCRRLRPDMQVIARANLDRNVSTLYRAGADAVLSYASTGASAIWSWLRPGDSLLLAEGLDVFRAPVPARMVGRTIDQLEIALETGCAVLAAVHGKPPGGCSRDRNLPLDADAELILVGDDADQERFREAYGGTFNASSFKKRPEAPPPPAWGPRLPGV
jgi:voltage-gated potassium channel